MLGGEVRLLRPTNCANAPGGFSRCLGSAEEEFSRPISRLVVWGAGWGRKYAYLVLPTVLMPRGDFCPLGQVVWGLVGAKVRLPRPTNCANAPWWFIHNTVGMVVVVLDEVYPMSRTLWGL